MKPLNSRHLWVLKNSNIIKRCTLLGGSSTKIVTFGSEHFVRYSRHVRYLGCKFTNSVNLLAQSHWLIKKLSTLPKLGIKFGNVSLSAHFQNVNVTETWYNYFHDNKSLFHFGAFLGPFGMYHFGAILECSILQCTNLGQNDRSHIGALFRSYYSKQISFFGKFTSVIISVSRFPLLCKISEKLEHRSWEKLVTDIQRQRYMKRQAWSWRTYPNRDLKMLSKILDFIIIIIIIIIILIGIHSMQGWTATTSHRVTRKRSTKRLKINENRKTVLERTYS